MKKVIALLLAAVMVFALCACGQQGAEGKDPAAKLPEFKLGVPVVKSAAANERDVASVLAGNHSVQGVAHYRDGKVQI